MIVIPNKLRTLVEEYLKKQNRNLEQGGYFFGTASKLVAFLPMPNTSLTSSREYVESSSSREMAILFSQMIGADIIAKMHTHPGGSVVSENDLGHLRATSYPYMVVIGDQGEFRWTVVARDGNCEVGTVFSDEELEVLSVLFSKELGVVDLGRVSITPSGELLTSTKLGRAFLQLDEIAMKIEQAYKNPRCRWRHPSKAELKRTLNVPMSRINASLKRLKESGVIK